MKRSALRLRLRTRMPLAAVALVLVLAGCAAIPTDGSVKTGGVIDTETQVQSVFQPSGPQKGSSPTNIVTDFIQAALDPQNDYQTAREFLTGDVQQKWNPNDNVAVQLGTGRASLGPNNLVTYSTTLVATIDSTGVYTEQPRGTISPGFAPTFDLVQVEVDGSKQWRISNLKDGVVISESTFDSVYAAHPLFFFAPGYKYLVPDVRWFPTTESVTTRIANALLAGPTSWLAAPVLVTAFPPGTALEDTGVSVDSAVATVDLSQEAKQNTAAIDRARMQQQMSASLTSVANVRSVALTVAGVSLAAPSPANLSSVQPSVNPATLVFEKNALGFTTGGAISSIPGVSEKAKAIGIVGATYSDASTVLAARGTLGVYRVKSDSVAQLVDNRPGLADPSLDSTGFVWSVQKSRISSLRVYSADGSFKKMDVSTIGSTDHVISIDVSRDGSRLLLYLIADGAPRLVVAGIVRDPNNMPIKLAEPVSLAVSLNAPIDATWESDRAVAAIAGTGASATVTEYQIGGPSTALGSVKDATQIVGGNGSQTGLRVLDSAGDVWRATGTASVWQPAGYSASFLVTQQPE